MGRWSAPGSRPPAVPVFRSAAAIHAATGRARGCFIVATPQAPRCRPAPPTRRPRKPARPAVPLLQSCSQAVPRPAFAVIASAIGLRHVLPVQTMTISMLASRSSAERGHDPLAQTFVRIVAGPHDGRRLPIPARSVVEHQPDMRSPGCGSPLPRSPHRAGRVRLALVSAIGPASMCSTSSTADAQARAGQPRRSGRWPCGTSRRQLSHQALVVAMLYHQRHRPRPAAASEPLGLDAQRGA